MLRVYKILDLHLWLNGDKKLKIYKQSKTTILLAKKNHASLFWDCQNTVLIDYLHQEETNSEWYSKTLKILWRVIQNKRRGTLTKWICLLPVIARDHTRPKESTQSLLQNTFLVNNIQKIMKIICTLKITLLLKQVFMFFVLILCDLNDVLIKFASVFI